MFAVYSTYPRKLIVGSGPHWVIACLEWFTLDLHGQGSEERRRRNTYSSLKNHVGIPLQPKPKKGATCGKDWTYALIVCGLLNLLFPNVPACVRVDPLVCVALNVLDPHSSIFLGTSPLIDAVEVLLDSKVNSEAPGRAYAASYRAICPFRL